MDRWVQTMEFLDQILKKMITKNQGGDFSLDRLLSYLKKQIPFQMECIKQIRNHVFIIESPVTTFVLKGFPSNHRCRLQETFTSTLKMEGFTNTYSFLEIAKKPPLYFQHTYYGCIEYIPPSVQTFTYQNLSDCLSGLDILHQFHVKTADIVDRYKTLLGRFNLLEKWVNRKREFLNYRSVVENFCNKEVISEMISWADWSLQGIDREFHAIQNAPMVVLHGDVAHHNFLRSIHGDIYLIDFDLISIGHASMDFLQYANRILPALNWSLEDLFKMEKMKPYLKEKVFLYGLAYPTDIFREWNRIVRERQYIYPQRLHQVMELTMNQYGERQKFLRDIHSILD